MTYTERLIEEFKRIADKTKEGGLRKRSTSVKMARLRNLISLSRNEPPAKAKWLTKLFYGRACRVPFRFKFERY